MFGNYKACQRHPLPQRKLGPISGQGTHSPDDGPQLALGRRVYDMMTRSLG